MFKIVRLDSAALISISVSFLWFHQVSAAALIPAQTCDINDPKSTIESCDVLIKEYKEYLTVTEMDIRSKNASDPYRPREMQHYEELERKLYKAISNRAKIKERK